MNSRDRNDKISAQSNDLTGQKDDRERNRTVKINGNDQAGMFTAGCIVNHDPCLEQLQPYVVKLENDNTGGAHNPCSADSYRMLVPIWLVTSYRLAVN